MDIKQKRRKFNALLAVAHMMEAKKWMLAYYGVDSTTELSEKQLDELIAKAQDLVNKSKEEQDFKMRKWRHRCLRMMAACGVDTQDWNAVNAFMMDPRICGRHLYELNVPELMTLHRKLHNVRDRKAAKKHDIKWIAIQN